MTTRARIRELTLAVWDATPRVGIPTGLSRGYFNTRVQADTPEDGLALQGQVGRALLLIERVKGHLPTAGMPLRNAVTALRAACTRWRTAQQVEATELLFAWSNAELTQLSPAGRSGRGGVRGARLTRR